MRLNDLPDINFVNANKDAVESELLQMYTTITGRTLGKADPIRLFILCIANVVILLLNKINDTGKQNLLAYARGANLDHLGAALGVERIQATGASTTMRLVASMARPEGIEIPKGTRFTVDGNILFETIETQFISGNGMQIDVSAVCQSVGSAGNGIPIGAIRTLVDPIPYIDSVTNITASEGGADTETDDAFRERIREAPESFSCAGSEGAYVYHAKRASRMISSVKVVSPKPGDVVVYPVLSTGELVGQEIINDIMAILSDKYVRPLTDHVSVKAPTVKDYNIDMTYYIDSDDSYIVSSIQSRINAAVQDFIVWQKTVAGRDINPSELTRRIMEAGAKRVDIRAPAFTKVKEGSKEDGYMVEIAMCKNKTITYGGLEHA